MMQVYLDDKPIDVPRPTLAAALAEGVRLAEAQGRIVVGATMDGKPIPSDTLASPPDVDQFIDEIRLSTDHPSRLIVQTLSDASAALDQLVGVQGACAELIQTGKSSQAMERLGEAVDTWQAVREVMDRSLELLGLDAGGLSLPTAEGEPEVTVSECAARLADRLRELQRTLHEQDLSALADLLEFELTEEARAWEHMFAVFAQRVAGT